MPRAIKGYLIGSTSSDKIFRIYIPSEHKVSETRQIHWTTKTIAPLGPTIMEPLISQETYVKVSPPSFLLACMSTDKPIKQEPEETIIPPTTFQPTTTEPSSAVLEQHLPIANPDTPNTQSPAPEVQPWEVPGPGRKSESISTRQPLSYKRQLGHRGRLASSEIPDEDPTTYRKGIESLHLEEWTSAMNNEIKALKKNKIFEVVDKPIGRNIVGSKWVFKTKRNTDGILERYRARAVSQGFLEAPGFDFEDTFAPVIRYESLCLLLALWAKNKWRPRQFDVKSAFLYGKLKEEVYMPPPPGFGDGDKVWKLNRCIYGLKQSVNEWYALFAKFLICKNFTASHQDPCMFIHNEYDCYISLYVNDIAIYSADTPHLTVLINDLKRHLRFRTSGKLLFYSVYI